MLSWSFVVCLASCSLVSHGWDLKSIEKKSSRQIRDTAEVQQPWVFWKNASKVYNNVTCEDELRPYEEIPKMITDPGTIYDVKALNVFKTIGDAFLEMITRKSLFDTIQLAMELEPINSLSKVLKIVEYQLTMVILICLGVLTATFILIFYIIFWSLKLTGNISEVKSQRIADSEGPMRFILSFLLSIFTVLVMFGCIIAWVANTHISNNVNEASRHIQWTVNVTENFTKNIEDQMNMLFLKDYQEIQLGILRTRINQAVTNASSYVYLEIAQNVSDMYNKSLMVADSIGNHQKPNIVAIEALYKQYNETLYPFLVQLKESKTCLETIKKWCDASANSGKCDADKDVPASYLTSVDPEKWYYDEIIVAKADVVEIADKGQLGANARLAYFNGKYFHNGTLEDPNTKFYGEQPSYTNECLKTDLTTGKLLHTDNEVITKTISKRTETSGETSGETGASEETAPKTITVPKNTIKTSITCADPEGCRIEGTGTKLFWGQCCVSIQYFLDQSDPNVNNTDYTKCGPKEIKKDGVVQPGGNQSDYRGNTTVTVTGKACLKWAEVDKGSGDDAQPWDAWAAGQGYTGLFWNDDPEEISFKHSFCRNPSPQKGLYGTATDDDVKTRAWCFYGTGATDWEYCNVPFCAPSTAAALVLAATSGATAFEYPTCETLETNIYGDRPTASNFTMWKTSTDARNGAYFALDEAASEMRAQYEVIQERFNTTNEAFDSLKTTILNSISSESDASKFDDIRNIGTICIVTFCMLSACLAVAGVCMGYCNITDVPPHLRTTACSWGGRLIKISSYWAAMMAIINLYMATLFFIPGSAFSLVCKDYYAGKFFKLFDDKVIVDYYVLGRAVLGNDSYPMLFQYLLENCNQSKTLWTSLGLNNDPDYKIENMMQLNESLDVNYTISTLLDSVSLNFDDYPAYPDKLKQWLSFWNVSNATQVPWGSVKSNFANNFMGLTYSQVNTKSDDRIKIDNRDFCDAFSAYGSQVTETAGDVFECKQLFTNQKVLVPDPLKKLDFKKEYCEEWIKNYEEMDGWIDNLQTKANLIQAQHAKYGPEFMQALIDEYDNTNNNLLNKGTTFSKSIINQTYMTYWQPMINNEVGCFSWWVDETLIHDLVVCYPIAKILDNTMNYFCGYMVSAMTLAWMSQGLLGLVLAFHMLVASSLATYFLKLEERHPDDISKEDMIAGFQ